MAGPISYFQGDLLNFNFSLRSNDACVPGKQNPWPIPAGAVVTVRLPGTPAGGPPPVPTAVVLSSVTAVAAEFGGGFEVTINSAADGDCSGVLVPTKGALLNASALVSGVAQPQTFDIVVLDSMGAQLQTFEVVGSIKLGTGIAVSVRAVA